MGGCRRRRARSTTAANCRGFIGPTGERVPNESKNVIVWVECPRCLLGRLEAETEEEKQRRQEDEERVRPRECELRECGAPFMARTPWQRFCSDVHRWRAPSPAEDATARA
jgi:hypothetical protein